MKQEQSKRIQTSVLGAAEKRVLVWLAQRQPRWVTSDMLTAIGVVGAIVVAVGYILSNYHIGWLWLASLGFVINGNAVDVMIEKEPINRSLRTSHACQRAIERIAIPVDDKA